MKYLLLLGLLVTLKIAKAVPIVNENEAVFTTKKNFATIYADHNDPNRFYIAPNYFSLASSEKNRPLFSYTEYRRYIFNKVAIVQMVIKPFIDEVDIQDAVDEIRKTKPKAQFFSIPFLASELEMGDELHELIEEQNCHHKAGLVGQEQACRFVLSPKGRDVFLANLKSGGLMLTFNFIYSFSGFLRTADGGLRDTELTHGLSFRLTGDQLKPYPELIKKM